MHVVNKLTALLAATLVMSSCDSPTQLAPSSLTPDKQFIFEAVRIEEHQNDSTSWVGTAERATGDLTQAEATGIEIHHYANGPTAAAMLISSPKGELFFEDRKATLTTVRIVTPNHGTVRGGNAHYDGNQQHVAIDGPLTFDAPGLKMQATSGEIFLDSETLTIAGPVVGEFEPGQRATAVTPR